MFTSNVNKSYYGISAVFIPAKFAPEANLSGGKKQITYDGAALNDEPLSGTYNASSALLTGLTKFYKDTKALPGSTIIITINNQRIHLKVADAEQIGDETAPDEEAGIEQEKPKDDRER